MASLSVASARLGHCTDVRCMTALPPKADVYPLSCYVAQVPQAVMPLPPVAWLMYPNLRADPTGRAEVPFFGGRLMPSAGIPLRPSFVRSIHARIARPRPFTRVQ